VSPCPAVAEGRVAQLGLRSLLEQDAPGEELLQDRPARLAQAEALLDLRERDELVQAAQELEERCRDRGVVARQVVVEDEVALLPGAEQAVRAADAPQASAGAGLYAQQVSPM
jgi:hypothetical protein